MKNRNFIIDVLRVIAILGVIGNHLLYPVVSRADFFGGLAWWVAFFIYSLSLVGVPIFIMISGYLLIDREDSIKEILNRTFNKLIIPLVFWFGFYLVWKTKFRSIVFSISEIINFIMSGNMFIFYFLVILIGLYLLLPLIQLIAKHGSEKLHSYILYGSFFITWFVGIFHYFSDSTSNLTSLVTWALPFFSYFWWGFMVKKRKFVNSANFFKLFLSWGLVVVFFGYVGFLLSAGNATLAFKNGIFYWHDYLNPAVSFMSIGLFTWLITSQKFKKINLVPIFYRSIFSLSLLSYGAYLSHMFVIDYLDIKYRYAIEFVGNNLVQFVLTRSILTVFLSFTIAYLISKVKYLRKIIGIA